MNQIKLSDIDILDVGNTLQIAGTVWSNGRGLSFITLVPGKDEDLSNLQKMPLTLDEWDRFMRQADMQETYMFQQDPTGKIVKALFRKNQRQIDSYVQWAAFKRDGYACRYCGRDGIPLSVDHIDLYENGGATILINLLTSCKQCNKTRGNMGNYVVETSKYDIG